MLLNMKTLYFWYYLCYKLMCIICIYFQSISCLTCTSTPLIYSFLILKRWKLQHVDSIPLQLLFLSSSHLNLHPHTERETHTHTYPTTTAFIIFWFSYLMIWFWKVRALTPKKNQWAIDIWILSLESLILNTSIYWVYLFQHKDSSKGCKNLSLLRFLNF
jgi:hypothetical protein